MVYCENYIGSVYVGGYCSQSESEHCVFGKLCPVGFLVVCKCLSVLLRDIGMLIVVMIRRWSDDNTC